MSEGMQEILILCVICVVDAFNRLLRMPLSREAHCIWGVPKEPSCVPSVLELLAALFVAIPMTLVWGLFLLTTVGIWHLIVMWKLRLSNSASN